MPDRIDRHIRGKKWVFVIIVILTAAAITGWYVWSLREVPVPLPGAAQQGDEPLIPTPIANAPLAITLYYPSPGGIAAAPLGITRQPDTQSQAKEAVAALLKDQHAVLAGVLKDVQLRAVYIDSSGAAFVDLSSVRQRVINASAWEEMTAIYAIVNTLTHNFEEVRQVHFLLEGKEAQTLAGHVDLSSYFTQRTDLVKQ